MLDGCSRWGAVEGRTCHRRPGLALRSSICVGGRECIRHGVPCQRRRTPCCVRAVQVALKTALCRLHPPAGLPALTTRHPSPCAAGTTRTSCSRARLWMSSSTTLMAVSPQTNDAWTAQRMPGLHKGGLDCELSWGGLECGQVLPVGRKHMHFGAAQRAGADCSHLPSPSAGEHPVS